MSNSPEKQVSFFERPGVSLSQVTVGGVPIPLGMETVANSQIGIAGVYGAWGASYDNAELPELIASRLGEPLGENERMHLDELGFLHRHHVPGLSPTDQVELEVEVGARFLRQAAQANGWEPDEVDAVLIGASSPVCTDFTERIAEKAGILAQAIKVSVHKACDGSVGGLHLALNPGLAFSLPGISNLAQSLLGKKVLVGGIEGLSRFLQSSRDKNAWQLFGNGAGVIGLIPGKSLKFLVGKTYEDFDREGLLQVRMDYPHAAQAEPLLDVRQENEHHLRLAGRMHEPEDGSSVVMAGPMGMVKLFVRNGAQVVRELYAAYQARLGELNLPGREIAVAIAHHANYKINKLLEKNLLKEGVQFPMPWLLTEFGNVSAASNMIAFLRKLPELKPGQHVLVDGFGAGTYYDALVVEIGG